MININMGIPELLSIIAFLALGVAYIYTQWKTGGSKASSEVIGYYKEQASIHTAQITNLTKELGILKGQLDEKDKRIELLTKIVENRNPEMEAFMKTMLKAAQDSEMYIQNSTKILGDISSFMSKMEPALTTLANK